MEPTCMSENKKKIIFIVNPISGTQSKELVLSLLDEKIDKEMYTWEIVYTERYWTCNRNSSRCGR